MIKFKFLIDNKWPKDYHNLPDFEFVGVSPIYYDVSDDEPYRHLVFKFIPDGTIIKAELIKSNHPMFDYHVVIIKNNNFGNQ